MAEPLTRTEFRKLGPFEKGVAVYMMGERDDEPNVPAFFGYSRNKTKQREYQRGQRAAVQECQDNP